MSVGGKLLRFVLLQLFVVGTLCCSCAGPAHPQRNFCRSEYVLKVDIKNNLTNNTYVYRYSVEIKTIYKGDLTGLKDLSGRVRIEMPNSCEIDTMTIGQTWIIFGSSYDGAILTNVCSGDRLWSATSKFMQSGLDSNYGKACTCVDGYMEYHQCTWNFSYFEVGTDGKCRWNNNEEYKKCLERNP